eukprot:CAMPEP_0197451446 /NCGR_PEP_ID=MMETSP1175-20131217/28902_1 /TAXON_ID=1003142 /ORGANISM="Triceratium dubium, Strain CCMP147" /LENGTH=269 /DNA_ID=CAMNT_0042984163 /DNA_START=43 /DNA_END=852 /DNA_ORIENTATION=+
MKPAPFAAQLLLLSSLVLPSCPASGALLRRRGTAWVEVTAVEAASADDGNNIVDELTKEGRRPSRRGLQDDSVSSNSTDTISSNSTDSISSNSTDSISNSTSSLSNSTSSLSVDSNSTDDGDSVGNTKRKNGNNKGKAKGRFSSAGAMVGGDSSATPTFAFEDAMPSDNLEDADSVSSNSTSSLSADSNSTSSLSEDSNSTSSLSEDSASDEDSVTDSTAPFDDGSGNIIIKQKGNDRARGPRDVDTSAIAGDKPEEAAAGRKRIHNTS